MHIIDKLADRLLKKVAPAVTVDAACIFLYTEKVVVGTCPGSSTLRWKYTTHYDNCPPKVTYSC